MKTICSLSLLVVLCYSINAQAPAGQNTTPSNGASPKQVAVVPTVAAVIDRQITAVEKDVVAVAEAMPEDKYDLSPVTLGIKGGYYLGARSFSGEVKHIATANYVFWCPLTGEKLPPGITGPNGPATLKTKSEIIKYLKESYLVGHRAAASLTPENLVEIVLVRQNKAPRLYAATFEIAHSRDHYGQLVEYLRMNGIAPPASRGGS